MYRSFSFLNRNERTATIIQRHERRYVFVFQFPQSERTNCNSEESCKTCQKLLLSVSSIGTNELQLRREFQRRRRICAFSFLNRNERTATLATLFDKNYLANFQFPQSERTNCNVNIRLRQFVPFPAFSFLNRNERTATIRGRIEIHALDIFQFPQSERTNCNPPASQIPRASCALSVSSIGTNELQRSSTC